MPGADEREPFRFVVDECSFDFRASRETLADRVDDFCDVLHDIASWHPVAISSNWAEARCADGSDLCDMLYGRDSTALSRDSRQRLSLALDRCPRWEADDAILSHQVRLGAAVYVGAPALLYALRGARGKRYVACVAMDSPARLPAWQAASDDDGTDDVFILLNIEQRTEFWRGLFSRENVGEQDFIERAREAFPDLVFAPSLSFRKFDGNYRELRDWVVTVLGVVHDHFPTVLREHKGLPDSVQAALGQFGLNLSPESPKTRNNPKVIKQRDVEHEGVTYRCEWHAKKEGHRNRVHFSVPEPRLGGRILIGIFVDHLDT